MMLKRALRMALLPVQARGFTTTMYGRSLKDEEERQRRPYDATSAVPTHDLRRKRVVRVRRKKQGYTVAAAPKRVDLDTQT
ncbi:hypothetical protein DIPPA_17709 [Diplonema papillatum]|nr:hypothetical protein DIPPA_17709 [Diplonema papillatum]